MWAFFHRYKITSAQIILVGFALVILLGTVLLMLPVSSRAGTATGFADCLFTATSAVCVTGLVVRDTATHWSFFGQAVILILIQIGGMGVITVAAIITMVSGKKISLMQRSAMQDAVAAPQVGGIARFTGFIVRGIFLFELLGALVLMTVFLPEYGPKGIWLAVFHSISAFCNAGFDLMGQTAPFSSVTGWVGDPIVNLTLILLILVGGLGFAPSANIGDATRIYEAVHGSAPDIAGQDKANPSAILMAFAMMLNDLGLTEKAERLNRAILEQTAEGKVVTADVGGTAGTKAFTAALIRRL